MIRGPMIRGTARRLHVIREPRTMIRAGGFQEPGIVATPHRRALLILLAALPMFGQTFYYLVEFPPPYFLSKAWPFLMLPLGIYALLALDLPYKALFGVLLAYVLGLTPLLGMIHFGNGFVDALTTTVKVWPFTYYFALAALLAWLRPAPEMVIRAFLILGALTFLLMWAIWILVPAGWYTSDAVNAKLLPFERERGYRVYMPMFFGMLFVFYLARRFGQGWEWWVGLLLAGTFVTFIVIYKQRTSILAALAVVALVLVSSTRGSWRRFSFAMSLAAAAVAVAFLSGAATEQFADSLGGSLSVRLRSIGHAIDFLGDDPMRWLFGVGATTRFSTVTFADIFGDKQFYLADIGWLGVVFEYGLVGAGLVVGVYLAGLVFAWQTGAIDRNPFTRALGDYILFLFLTSAVYSFVFTPGELATIVATAAYLRSAGPLPWSEPMLALDSVNYRRGTVRRIFQRISAVSHAPAHQETSEPTRLPR